MRIRWTPQAAEDLAGIVEYIRTVSSRHQRFDIPEIAAGRGLVENTREQVLRIRYAAREWSQ